MKHRALDQLAPVAKIVAFDPAPSRVERRARLRRLATLIEAHDGPVLPFYSLERVPEPDRHLLQQDSSPFAVAFHDAQFRLQGLTSDRVGDGMEFFGLSWGQTHRLLCECNYTSTDTQKLMAARVRKFAERRSIGEIWSGLAQAVWARSR